MGELGLFFGELLLNLGDLVAGLLVELGESHVSVQGGRPSRTPNEYTMCENFGNVSRRASPVHSGSGKASTEMGSYNFNAVTAMFIVWQAMSPKAPVPKSIHPRHANGWYSLL